MDKDLFDDFVQSLNEAIDYAKGDKTKARSTLVTLPSEDEDVDGLLFQKIISLPGPSKQRAMQFVDELLQASGQ